MFIATLASKLYRTMSNYFELNQCLLQVDCISRRRFSVVFTVFVINKLVYNNNNNNNSLLVLKHTHTHTRTRTHTHTHTHNIILINIVNNLS